MAHPHPTAKSKGGRGRRWLCVFLTLLTLFLLGTVVVLSTVVAYFGVDQRDVITEREMDRYERLAARAVRAQPKDHQKVVAAPAAPAPAMDDALERRAAAQDVDDDERESDAPAAPSASGSGAGSSDDEPRQRIPKIVHQTWMVDTLPDRWEKVRQGCQALHPDYEYMLWTDAGSREFIATNYPWFLSAFDGYPYPIQRADAIRYFVLHHYGGIYMDLDVGCQQRMDPLLYFPVILPATIPVGVSNDIMLSEKGHPFMDLVIHNLVTFNHQYGTNYPTVMFSTGPMFLSAQYGLWPKEDPEARIEDRQVRILPRRWYGKNAPEGERELAYFSHFYGSSWHADDAGFITFLGKFGVALMYMGFGVVFFGAGRLLWSKRFLLKNAPRASGPIALPFHVPDPYGRPGTPGSRPGSPAHGHQRRESDGGPPSQPQQRGGVLYYLPVWFLPPGTSASPSNGNGQGGWTQYIPGFAEDATERGYHPIPGYSRPPSPSGNSIYNAAGAVHDGAFDGQPLDSLRQPLSPRPSTASAPSSPTASSSPPAYTTLKGWGSFFRPSLSGPSILSGINNKNNNNSGPVLPLAQPTPRVLADAGIARYTPRTVAQSGHVAPGDRAHAHERTASGSSGSQPGPGPRHRARSPLPPAYAGPAPLATEGGFAPPSPGGPGHRRGSSHSPVPFTGDGLASAHPVGTPARRQTPQPVPAEVQDDLIPSDEWDGDNDNVEDEVDRLLRELEPDVKAHDD